MDSVEPEHLESLGREVAVSPQVRCYMCYMRATLVLGAIDLSDQPGLWSIEVNDVVANWFCL